MPELLKQLASPDTDMRDKALSRFCSAVHPQGDVTSCTIAALPFLLDLACDIASPDRLAVVALLVSIGEAIAYNYGKNYVDYDGATPSNRDSSAVLLRPGPTPHNLQQMSALVVIGLPYLNSLSHPEQSGVNAPTKSGPPPARRELQVERCLPRH